MTTLEKRETLKQKLKVLQSNEQNCSLDDLQGKYSKAYNRLKEEIYQLACDELAYKACCFLYPTYYKDRGLEITRNAFLENKTVIYTAIFEHYNVDEMDEIAEKINSATIDDFFSNMDASKDDGVRWKLTPWNVKKVNIIS